MTKKHFEAIAKALRELKPSSGNYLSRNNWLAACDNWEHIVDALGDMCYSENSRFDITRFRKACGWGNES